MGDYRKVRMNTSSSGFSKGYFGYVPSGSATFYFSTAP